MCGLASIGRGTYLLVHLSGLRLNISQILASASYDNTIKFYVDDPTDDWYCTATLTGHTSTVWALAWSPDGRYIASGSDDKTVKVWQRTGQFAFKEVLELRGHDRAVFSVSWSKGTTTGEGALGWLASTGSDGMIFVWDLTVRVVVPSCYLLVEL